MAEAAHDRAQAGEASSPRPDDSRRSTSFQTSETETTSSPPARQISHWLPVSSTVSRMRWKNCSSVAKMIAPADSSDVIRNVRSLNVSRLNTDLSLSRAVKEKHRFAMANVV